MYDDYYEEDFNEDYDSEYCEDDEDCSDETCEGDDYCGNNCDNCPYVTDDDGDLDLRTTVPVENVYLFNLHEYDELPLVSKINESSLVSRTNESSLVIKKFNNPIKKFNDPITLAETGKIQTKTF